MLPCHHYQRDKAEHFGGKLLTVACKEDPAKLADLGATNCDVNDYDPQERMSLYEVPNFVVGDAIDLPFEDHSFDTIVLGEFLEHCPHDAAVAALTEMKRVLTKSGHLLLTFPRAGRPKEVPPEPHLLEPLCWW